MSGDPALPLVLLGAPGSTPAWLTETLAPVAAFDGGVEATLEWAVHVGHRAPKPAGGETATLWELLASTAAIDVGVARMLEPHLDALAILDQAQQVDLERIGADATSSWGVFAAEAPGTALTAASDGTGWKLSGEKPWCSLAEDLSHALVTARTGESTRRLFAVNLRHQSVDALHGPWVSRGLRQVVSAPVRFDRVPAVPVGPDQWYLQRSGFAWGGAGVAACWWGGAVGIAHALFSHAQRRDPDQLALAALGAVDSALAAARSILAQTAALIDGSTPTSDTPAVIARRARNVVAASAESVMAQVGHALGPAPLALDEIHARRVADLGIYLRQHHAERDEAAQGRDLASLEQAPW